MNGPIDTKIQSLSVWRKVARRAGIMAGTALVGLLATGSILGTTSMISANTVRVNVEQTSPPLSVAVVEITRQSEYKIPAQFIGRIEASRNAGLGFEFGGAISEVLVDEGVEVSAGEVLAVLDTRALEAERNRQVAAIEALDAQIELAELTAERQRDLAERSFASQQRADETRLRVRELNARRDELSANLESIDIRLDKSVLRAPFAGKITSRNADEGSRIGPMTPVVALLETGAPRVRVGLPSDITASLQSGATIQTELDGTAVNLKLISFGADIDPLTRTRSVLFAIEGSLPPSVSFGQVVRLDAERVVTGDGAWMPVSALVEGTRGLWTVFLAAETESGPVSRRESVEILYADEDRAFVRGAFPDGAHVIIDGPHRLGSEQSIVARAES